MDSQLRRAPARLWRLLGAVVALTEQLAETPMLPAHSRRLHEVYLIKGAVATTAIEGNTLSVEEVAKLKDKQLTLPPSKEYLGIEIQNMIRAFDGIMAAVASAEHSPISALDIKRFNGQILHGLVLDEGVVPGEASEHGVVVGAYRGAPRRDCDHLIDRLCTWLEGGVPTPGATDTMETAIIRALLAHLYLAWIHAFGDGNGRTARLVEFFIMAAGGVPGPAAHLLSNHFNDTRGEYYRQLNHASRSGGDVLAFLGYALQGFHDGLVAQLHEVRGQTEDLIWRELVEEAITAHGAVPQRRRALAVSIFRQHRVVRRPEMLSLTPQLVLAYAGKTGKTLTRDLHELVRLELIRPAGRGAYAATEEMIMGLMPRRAPTSGLRDR